jgi:alpha-amylase/alpha-mannosidase (GH57 family)
MVSSSDTKLNEVNNAVVGEPLPLTKEENGVVVTTQILDPLKTATGVYVTIHGHFYQPPRENPYLGTIERQPSAAPFHNWNERIDHECYRPNAFARVLNDGGELVGIVNNYEYLSFNIGATLMNWLERYDRSVYQKIIEADRKSCQRLNGHGNAIAQVYNHIIMPLANERDKYTQIRWGKEDFRSHFGRDPEGMWLAETAVDYATLEALVAEGIKFIILAPSQAERCRPLATDVNPDPHWVEVGGGEIDATRPYRCYLKAKDDSSERPYIDIFFYDGPISNDMGFSDVLNSSHNLVGRLGQAVRNDERPTQVISVATDGETFGHHKGGTEKCLAYAFSVEFAQHHWTVTNFAHYLSICPPSWEVELKPVTAWSCCHGVERWQDDCGCGGGGAWHQQWRRPLRESLNWLRDRLAEVYEDAGSQFFVDVWAARDEYVRVMRDRSVANVNRFLMRHQAQELSELEKVDALRLLEMQRHSLLMFTSCGWFFEEISRPEGTQILRYASRAMELAGDVAGVDLEKQFLELLAFAPSNVESFRSGDEIYRQLVITAQVSLEQVAAHYAINSLFATYARDLRVYCYNAKQLDYQLRRMGTLSLAVGHLQLISEVTHECKEFVFAVLHLGSWDFHCCIQPFKGRRFYSELKEQLFASLEQASVAHAIMAMTQFFGEQSFSLSDLFAEERQRIMKLLSQETVTRLNQLYTQVYRDNYGIMMAFRRDELPIPQELQVAAEVALGHQLLTAVRLLEAESSNGEINESYLTQVEAIVTEAGYQGCDFHTQEVKEVLERLLVRSVEHILHHSEPGAIEAAIRNVERLLDLGHGLDIGLSITRAQEVYLLALESHIVPLCLGGIQRRFDNEVALNGDVVQEWQWQLPQIRKLLYLGKKLAIEVDAWLEQL